MVRLAKPTRSIVSSRSLALAAISLVVGYLVFQLAAPFLPAMTWALALAVSAYPLHQWLERRLRARGAAAFVAVVIVAIAVVLPVALVSRRLAHEAVEFRYTVQAEYESGRLRESIERIPHVATWLPWLEGHFLAEQATGKLASEENSESTNDSETSQDPQAAQPLLDHSATLGQMAGLLTSGAGTVIAGTFWILGQLFVTFLALFFFFRDRAATLRFAQKLTPLSESEAKKFLSRVDDVIHATVYGSLTVAAIQGTMGGLIFWYLGLPSPLLWGAIMGMLAVVPVLGTFVIWAPTAAYLALRGDWGDALLLAAWGGIAIALVDNFIYPYLVGQRLRYHTLLIFLAMVGGIALFGASGVILGPLLLAVADTVLDAWHVPTRRRSLAATS